MKRKKELLERDLSWGIRMEFGIYSIDDGGLVVAFGAESMTEAEIVAEDLAPEFGLDEGYYFVSERRILK